MRPSMLLAVFLGLLCMFMDTFRQAFHPPSHLFYSEIKDID